MTTTRRRMGRWTVVVEPLRLGPIPLGHIARLEDGPLFRASLVSTWLYVALGEPLRRLLGWWRPTHDGALYRGSREALGLVGSAPTKWAWA